MGGGGGNRRGISYINDGPDYLIFILRTFLVFFTNPVFFFSRESIRHLSLSRCFDETSSNWSSLTQLLGDISSRWIFFFADEIVF